MAREDERARRGALAEARACAWLQRQGLRIVQCNYRVRGGEIDIIAHDRRCLVFVEVRQRADVRYGGAAASVDARKRARLLLAARHYLMRVGDAELRCRFDVIAIDGGELHWIRDAFGAD
jgi:putative endonuclease